MHGPAAEWGGAWHGTYVCYQGITGLDLTIKALDADNVMAVFSFHAIPQNPLLPSGEFTMTGQPGPNPGHLRLSASSWTTRPPGYVSISTGSTIRRAASIGGGSAAPDAAHSTCAVTP
jgi:hypothetical protein